MYDKIHYNKKIKKLKNNKINTVYLGHLVLFQIQSHIFWKKLYESKLINNFKGNKNEILEPYIFS